MMKLDPKVRSLQFVDNDAVDVEQIISEMCYGTHFEEPVYICNIDDIFEKHKIWIAKLPRVVPFYAVKCNDSEIVLTTLALLGVGFDCASKAEIQKVLNLNLNIPSERIIFANPTKPASHIRYAEQHDVKTMTFDTEIELHKIKQLCSSARVVLRIRCDAEDAQCPLGNKYGCDPSTEAPQLIKCAKILGLNLVGISFHVGSGCKDYYSYYKAIKVCRAMFDIASNYGFELSLLDIGGGYPGDKGKSIDEVAMIINQSLDEFFPADEGIKVIAEPGRYYVASAYTLITSIHSKKLTQDNTKNETIYSYYINDGVYGSFNCQLYDHQVCNPKLLKPRNQDCKTFRSVIFGPSCDGLDTIAENIMLPQLDVGDCIIWENMGAYTLVCASPFNGFPVPIELCFVGKLTWKILKNLLPDIDGLPNCFTNNRPNQAEKLVCV